MAGAQSEIGPVLPSRGAVYAVAHEVGILARRAEEFASAGPTADLGAAVRQLDRIRALLGAER